MIVAGMATVYNRRDLLIHTARSIAGQVDMLHLYCSGFQKSSLPKHVLDIENLTVFTMDELRRPVELGDAGKFFEIPHDCYYLSCDDDIYYEPGYAQYMVDAVDRYRKNAWITIHGVDIKAGKYPDCRKRITHFQKEAHVDMSCMVPGTGVSAFHSSMVRIPITLFKYSNCADMWIAHLLQKFEISCVTIENPEPKKLCRSMGDGEDSIWSKRKITNGFNNEILKLTKHPWKNFPFKHEDVKVNNPSGVLSANGFMMVEVKNARFEPTDWSNTDTS